MKKRGFTLVELLAVIAILAILVIIALPNVLGMFQSAKKNTFTTELQNIYKSATTQYVSDSMNRGTGSQARGIYYTRSNGDGGDTSTSCGSVAELDLSGTETIDYYIEFDLSGNVVTYVATDGEFVFWFNPTSDDEYKKLAIEDIGSKVGVYTIAEEAGEDDKSNYFTVHIERLPENLVINGVCYMPPNIQRWNEDEQEDN